MSDKIYDFLFFLFLNMLVDITLALTVSAFLTSAGLSARYSCIKAFTIFFSTLTLLAVATMLMLALWHILHLDHGLFLVDTV